jgi:hypothetical protein
MGDDRPRERKARGLLSSYYGVGASGADPLDLDGPSFNSDKYVSRLLENQSLADLVHKGNDLVTEIKSLDSDMQMLVYENYNKFISATDTIRSMKEKVEGMEDQMNQLASNMETIIESNRSISSNVSGRRGQLEKLNGVRKLLVKLQFLFELPTKLQKCIEAGEHEKAVTYYAAATSILKHYGHLASFQSIHDEAVDIMTRLKAKLVEMLAGVQPSLAKLGLTVKLLLQLQGSEEDLLQRFVAHARTLCAAELAKLPVFAEAAGEGPAERMTTWSANASAVYQSAALETLELFASLFPRTRVGGAPSSSTDKSAGAQPSNAAIQRRLGLLQQCMDEVFGAYAKQITTAAHAGAAIEPLTIAIRALVEPTRAVAAESQGLHLSQEALAKRASAMGAELARGGIAAELKAFGTAASAAMAKLCAKGAAPAGGGSASLASTGLVKNDTVRELVHETCSAVLGAIDTAIQHVRPLLLALPAQGLVQDLVEQLMASILAFVASVRDASLAHAPHGEARAEGEVAGLFLACTTCVQLAQRMRTELQQMVSGHLMFARAEYSAPLPVSARARARRRGHSCERATRVCGPRAVRSLHASRAPPAPMFIPPLDPRARLRGGTRCPSRLRVFRSSRSCSSSRRRPTCSTCSASTSSRASSARSSASRW